MRKSIQSSTFKCLFFTSNWPTHHALKVPRLQIYTYIMNLLHKSIRQPLMGQTLIEHLSSIIVKIYNKIWFCYIFDMFSLAPTRWLYLIWSIRFVLDRGAKYYIDDRSEFRAELIEHTEMRKTLVLGRSLCGCELRCT